MKLSIIIPVYRVERTLDRCIRSVIGQTFSDFELLLVDDGSPDRCPQMCDEWARKDSRIRVIHKSNGGLSDARNAGLDVAQGEYVTFVDSDDFLDEDTYRKLMPVAETCDIVEYPFCRHYGSRQQLLTTFRPAVYTDMEKYWIERHVYEHCYAWNKIYSRRLFDGVRFPVGRVFEDVATLPLLLDKASRVITTNFGCYYYCDNSRGITATADGKQLEQLLDAHIAVLGKWFDAAYYMHVLNIQADVYAMTGQRPKLAHADISPRAKGLSCRSRLKAVALKLLGVKGLCRTNKLIRLLLPSRS